MGRGKPRKESALIESFRRHLVDQYPAAFFYKIPDTFGIGGMRPFDVFAIVGGQTFCLEFKRGSIKKATEYQRFCLDRAQANGASSFVVNEQNKGEVLKAIEAIVTRGRDHV